MADQSRLQEQSQNPGTSTSFETSSPASSRTSNSSNIFEFATQEPWIVWVCLLLVLWSSFLYLQPKTNTTTDPQPSSPSSPSPQPTAQKVPEKSKEKEQVVIQSRSFDFSQTGPNPEPLPTKNKLSGDADKVQPKTQVDKNNMVNLEELKTQIESVGNKIKGLKSAAEVDKEAVGAAVKELLELKQTYADNNDGIGVDGKPFGKKEKKSGGGGGPPKETQDPNSANAKKKAAKKAAKAAAKAAHKAGTAPPATDAGGGGNQKGGNAAAAATTATNTTGKPVAVVPPPVLATSSSSGLELRINPNVPLTERPVIALTMAVSCNSVLDITILSDHRIPAAMLQIPQGGVIVGDLAMARFIYRQSKTYSALDSHTMAMLDVYMDYATSMKNVSNADQKIVGIARTLEHALASSTYLVGNQLTLADYTVFAALDWPIQYVDRMTLYSSLDAKKYPNTHRWIEMMIHDPAIQEATQLVVGIVGNEEAKPFFTDEPVLEPLVTGMNILEGAVPGRVVTRFPPEPSGYLHVGHAKAVLLNDYYARRYQGKLIVRFDDTNPSKEKEEYQQSIVEDLGKLGVKPTVVTYTSDYFQTIKQYAIYMIEQGLAYMDDTPQEQMKQERTDRVESKHRNQDPTEALKYFNMMCSGSSDGAVWCLRAKIDMQSDNGTLRDPVLFRQNTIPHHRSGTKYKAYPTYDLACPIVDSLEGVTHALRTTEYNDRDEQYQWILKSLGLRRVRIHAFSRVNFVHTVLSKRKLTWFVEKGLVTGWDDARFPTVRGVIRRGVNVNALKKFIYSQGASRRVVNMEWSKFWAENKKEIDTFAKRFMAIDSNSNTLLTVTNGPEDASSYLETTYHPKDPSMGKRVVRIAKEVLLETVDVDGIKVGEDIVLLRWGVVKITNVADGKLEGEFVPNGDFKAAKRKLSWMAKAPNNPIVTLTEFDNLISKEKLEEDDKLEDHINPNTMATTQVIGDPGLKMLQEHDIIQLERRGYYRVDRPYMSKDKPLILFMIPDGKAKAMSGLSGKLVHH